MKNIKGMAAWLLVAGFGLIVLAGAGPCAAQTQSAGWPDLLYGTWTGTICGEPITYIFYPGVVTVTEGYVPEQPDPNAPANAIIVRSRYMRGNVVRYDQYSVALDTSQENVYGDPLEGSFDASSPNISFTYDPQNKDMYGTYFATGAVCQDVEITKSSDSYDPELDNLTDEDFYHLFDFL